MRSKGSPERADEQSRPAAEPTGPVALGQLVAQLATEVRPDPYDLTPGSTGRRRLAEDSGMSIWAVARMLRGETLPKPENIGGLAEALGVSEDLLLDTAGYRNRSNRAISGNQAVLSVANRKPSPEAIADALGITHSFVRKMLISSIKEAVRLQSEADQHEGGAPGGTAAAR
ncbi:helix-turn-helix domain-containing protein [Streptomyces collinus]|uniref:helix-turn-helix domain-containing protein n=1 Tax=Streptomyces collinus TaxID=42684 RepID=UPI0036CF2633